MACCSSCYVTWAQQFGIYFLPIVLWITTRLGSSKSSSAPPTYGPWYLPAFVRGGLAAYRLGDDEDGFLVRTAKEYGPVVYLPWPLCQYFVLDGDVVQRVYETPSSSLSFVPIRKEMQGTVFGSAKYVHTNDEVMERQLFPAHAKGMAKSKLEPPLARFLAEMTEQIETMGKRIDEEGEGGELEVDFAKWVIEAMIDAATPALFGDSFLASSKLSASELRNAFAAFDTSFPLLASGLIAPFLERHIPITAAGRRGGAILADVFGDWVKDGMPGLSEGVVRDMANVGLAASFPPHEIGKLLLADCWALQANAPFAAVWLLLSILQSPSVLPSLLAEIASSKSSDQMSMKGLSTSLPLLSSCLTETLRLATSSFSIRIVESPFFLSTATSSNPSSTQGYMIPERSRIICATRVSHLDEERWEDAGVWDGRRFLDEESKEGAELPSKRAREVHGFGGGISICEGRHLATAELKAFVVLVLSHFEIELLYPTTTKGEASDEGLQLKLKGTSNGMRPKLLQGRVGMGVFQFEGDVRARIKRRAADA